MATEMRYGKDTYDFFPRMSQSLLFRYINILQIYIVCLYDKRA